MMISTFFNILFFLVPLIFWPKTSEVFEFNKMLLVYAATIVIITAWAIKEIRTKRFLFRRTILDIPLLLFLSTQLVSTLISPEPRTSLLGYYSRFNGGLLSSLCYALLYWAFVSNMTKKNTQTAIKTLLSSAVIIALWGTLEHFGHSLSCLFITQKFDNACWVQDVGLRVFATLGQPNWLAAFLTAIIPITWSLTLTTKGRDQKIKLLWFSLSALFFVVTLFTKSRSGLLGLAVVDIIFWLATLRTSKVSRKKMLNSFVILHLAFLIIIAVIGTPWTPKLSEFISSKTAETKSLPTTGGTQLETGGTESGDIRKIVWQGALDVWRHHPIFGTGVETFAYSYYNFRPLAHNQTSEWDFLYNKAHNEYLNFLATTGLVGTFAYLALAGFSLWQSRRQPPLLAGLGGILVTNFFGFSVVPTALLFFLYPAMAFTLEILKSKDKTVKKTKISNSQKILIVVVLIVSGYGLRAVVNYWRADLIYNQGRLAREQSLFESSLTQLQKAVKLSPKEALFHDQLARLSTDIALAAQQTDDPDTTGVFSQKAVEESQKATHLSPKNVNLKKSQASVYIRLANLDPNYLLAALTTLEETEKLAPTDPKVVFHKALVLARIGQSEVAIEELKQAIEMKPDYQDAINALKILQNP